MSEANTRLVVIGAGKVSGDRKKLKKAKKNANAHIIELTAQLKTTQKRLKRLAAAQARAGKQRVRLRDPARRVRLRDPGRRVRLRAPGRR